jgi:lysozyme family protein
MGRRRDYVSDPHDPGGETKFGISQRVYPQYNIKELTLDLAKLIYLADYWNAPKLDQLADIAPDLAIKTFDLGVNCGQRTAVKFLQRAVNTVCDGDVPPARAAAWRQSIARLMGGKPLRVDGIIGPITLNVIRLCPHHTALMAALKGEAYKHYAAGAALFRPGWLNRLES